MSDAADNAAGNRSETEKSGAAAARRRRGDRRSKKARPGAASERDADSSANGAAAVDADEAGGSDATSANEEDVGTGGNGAAGGAGTQSDSRTMVVEESGHKAPTGPVAVVAPSVFPEMEPVRQQQAAEPEAASEPEVAREPEAASEPEPAPEPEAATEQEAATEPEATSELEGATEPEVAGEPEAATEPEATGELEGATGTEADGAAESGGEVAVVTEAAAETEGEAAADATEVVAAAAATSESGEPTESPGRLTVARVLGGIGRTLIGAGLLILLFVGYQLWGTNYQESRSQNKLQSTFNSTLDKVGQLDPALRQALGGTTPTSAGQTATTGPPATIPREVIDLLSPQPGQAMAVIRIPKIHVERRVVEGTEVDDLRKGPGHYPETPLPGQAGNAAIAGHRTTYGAPFNRIDELAPGDEIDIQTVQGTAVYKVDAAPFVISPTQVEVLRNFGDNRLTLTSCHPKLSAAQRLVVTGQLVSAPFPSLPAGSGGSVRADIASTTTVAEAVENPSDPTATTATTASPSATAPTVSSTTAATTPSTTATTHAPAHAPNLQQGLGGDRAAWPGAIGWGLVTALVGLLAWAFAQRWDRRLGRRSRLRHLAVYAVASPFFAVLLFLCFENVDRLLPAY